MFAIKISVLRVHGLTRRICIQIKQQESNKTENDTFEITRPRFPARKQKKAGLSTVSFITTASVVRGWAQ